MLANLFLNEDHYRLAAAEGAKFRNAFYDNQVIVFPHFLRPEAFGLLTQEVQRLEQSKNRRDFDMPDSENSPRRMSTLGGLEIAEASTIIPVMYRDINLLAFLSGIAGEEVLPVADLVENHVCNFLHEMGDVHGGHVDTYAFAFNFMIESPAPGDGGLLEFVPRCQQVGALDDEKRVKRLYIPANSCYLLRTDQAVHRVSPLIRRARRTVLNFAYGNLETVGLSSYSTSVLYGSIVK